MPRQSPSPKSLRSFVDILRKEGELVEVKVPVSSHLEIAEIHRRVVSQQGKALLFTHVEGSSFPVVTNLFGSLRRIELAGIETLQSHIASLIHLLEDAHPLSFSTLYAHRKLVTALLSTGTKTVHNGPVLDHIQEPPHLSQLPLLHSWPDDGGAFITLPLVLTESPSRHTTNLGMYRVQRFDDETAGLHWQIGKGGGFHFTESEALNQDLPVAVLIGGSPSLMLSAIAPLPENMSELLLSSFMQNGKVSLVKKKGFPYLIPAESDFALLGYAKPHERRMEGPFGDHFGYMSRAHPFPFFTCSTLLHRNDAIYPATVVGKPPQEDT